MQTKKRSSAAGGEDGPFLPEKLCCTITYLLAPSGNTECLPPEKHECMTPDTTEHPLQGFTPYVFSLKQWNKRHDNFKSQIFKCCNIYYISNLNTFGQIITGNW